jgi:hypothetical protein
MVKTIIYCDRCGKECEKDRNNHGYQIFPVCCADNFDLCQKCYDELYDWMKSVKMKKAENSDECTYMETGCGSCKRQLDCPIEAEGEVQDADSD